MQSNQLQMNQVNSLSGIGNQANTGMGGGMQMSSGLSNAGQGGLGGFYADNSDPFAEIDQKPGQFGGSTSNAFGQS